MTPPYRPPPKPRLMDEMRDALTSRHYSRRTEQAYCLWTKRFIYFHKLRHPADMGEVEINEYLTTCGVPMVLRTAKRGAQQGNRFYGCANYPSCRQAKPA